MPWYPHYMSDYDRDTQHLSLTENGAYQRLLSYYYDKQKPLPTDNAALFRICRAFTPEEQAAVQAVVSQFFDQQTDGWHQKRADLEIERTKEISAVRAKAARSKSTGRTDLAHSEGKAENEKAGGERIEAEAEQANLQMDSNCSANAPTNAGANGLHLLAHITDHNTQITTHNPQVTDHKKSSKVRESREQDRADKPRSNTRIKLCDNDFIAELQNDEAYKHLSVRHVYNKMLVNCRRNNKQPTQNRLIAWLNREDQPMGNGNGSHQQNFNQSGSSGSDFEFKPRSVIH